MRIKILILYQNKLLIKISKIKFKVKQYLLFIKLIKIYYRINSNKLIQNIKTYINQINNHSNTEKQFL